MVEISHAYFVKFQLNCSILKILTFEPLYDPLMTFYNKAYDLSWFKNVTRILSNKLQLNWSILKMLTFETLYDPLMACYIIA